MTTDAQEQVGPAGAPRHAGRVVAIVNPTSGRGLGRKAFVQLRELLPRHCEDAELYLSQEPGFAARLLDGLPLPDGTTVIAAGGDGTVHEIGQALIGRRGIRLGVISVGSGNDVAGQLGMPANVFDGLRAILHGVALPWDVGTIGEHSFLNSVGFALSADTCWWSHQATRLRGLPRYAYGVARAWWGYRPLTLNLDGLEWSGRRRIGFMEIAIGDRAGGGYRITPDALVDDALLDVCAMEALSRWSILPLAARARNGSHIGHASVHYEQVNSFRIGLDRATRIHVDGEIRELPHGEHSVRIKPRALQMIVAPGHPRLNGVVP